MPNVLGSLRGAAFPSASKATPAECLLSSLSSLSFYTVVLANEREEGGAEGGYIGLFVVLYFV